MRSDEKRLQLMHKRADELKRRREGRNVLIGGGTFFVLLVALAAFAGQITVRVRGATESIYAGASMFDVSTGGFVLTAVLAFMAGVVLTVTIRKYRDKMNGSDSSGQSDNNIAGRDKP